MANVRVTLVRSLLFNLFLIHLYLLPTPVLGVCDLKVRSGVPAKVFINNEFIGDVSPSSELTLKLKKPGNWSLEVRAQGSPLLLRENIVVSDVFDTEKTISAFTTNPTNPSEVNPDNALSTAELGELVKKTSMATAEFAEASKTLISINLAVTALGEANKYYNSSGQPRKNLRQAAHNCVTAFQRLEKLYQELADFKEKSPEALDKSAIEVLAKAARAILEYKLQGYITEYPSNWNAP